MYSYIEIQHDIFFQQRKHNNNNKNHCTLASINNNTGNKDVNNKFLVMVFNEDVRIIYKIPLQKLFKFPEHFES